MPIPKLDTDTGYLPRGIHEATWDELVQAFGTTEHRQSLLSGLEAAMTALQRAGCKRLYVDGSFVTDKPVPGDYDGCWEAAGVDGSKLKKLEPSLLEFANGREAQKARFGGELFIAHFPADPQGNRFVDFFQRDQNGTPKGIVAINL